MTDPQPEPAPGWRSVLSVHPACAVFPPMSAEDLKALGKDILNNGMKRPITVLYRGPKREPPYLKEDCALLDGSNRLDSIEAEDLNGIEAGDIAVIYDIADDNLRFSDMVKVEFLSEEECPDPYSYVVSVNILHRHLTNEQKRELTRKCIEMRPERSDRSIAHDLKVSPSTVGAVRHEMAAEAEEQAAAQPVTSQLSRLDSSSEAPELVKELYDSLPPKQLPAKVEARIGRDGKTRTVPVKASKPAKVKSATDAVFVDVPNQAKTITALSTLVHIQEGGQLMEVLNGIHQALSDESKKLRQANIPMAKRAGLIRGFMKALGVELDDLKPIGKKAVAPGSAAVDTVDKTPKARNPRSRLAGEAAP